MGLLPVPSNLIVQLGLQSGQLKVRVSRVYGASSYNWRVATVAVPDVFVQTVQTPSASTLLTGLTPGVDYVVQVDCIGAAGTSDWTDGVTQVVV